MFRLVRRAPLTILAASLFGAPAAMGANYFVATTGNDNNPGTESRPFRTVVKAAQMATSPGDTVYIRGGVYSGGWDAHLSPQASGTADNPITFRNYPNELPILDGAGLEGEDGSGFEPTEVKVSHIRVEGLVARNWHDSGFSNGWDDAHASSNIEFVNCIADNNGVNGIAFNKASNVLIEHSITLHNGNQMPSWSSGVSLYEAKGTNRIIGNVSFENTDISDMRSDGSGFILDEGTTGASLVNNVAFRNGGSCIRLTKSPGGRLINNTCVQNGQGSHLDFNDEIYVSDSQSAQNAVAINNLIWAGKAAFGGQSISQMNNVTVNGAGTFVSASGALDFHLVQGATTVVDRGTSNSETPADDIGFDFKCLKQASGLAHWWQYTIDYEYVASVGGVAGCFRPGARSGSLDVGAYELGASVTGCTTDADCADTNSCTRDACGAGGKCTNLPIEGCCVTDADCVDSDACTIDSCNLETGFCSNAVGVECGENSSGEWKYDGETSYVSVCNWGGYHWSAAGPDEAGVNGTRSSITQGENICYTGVVAAHEGYNGYAMAGFNIRQKQGSNTEAANVVPNGDGLNISITNVKDSPLRVQLQDAPNAEGQSKSWCVEVSGAGGFFAWSDFNTTCWAPDDGVAYALEPVNVIAVMVASSDTEDREFDFCVNQLSPSNAVCEDPVNGGTPVSPAPTGGVTTEPGTSAPVPMPGGTDTPTSVTPGGPDPVGVTCQLPLVACGNICVDTTSDPSHCGACGNGCGASFCSQSACVASCAANQAQCGQACVDTLTSLLHCGNCDAACSAGQTCSLGQCVGETGVQLPNESNAASGCGCRVVGTRTVPRSSGWAWLGALALVSGLGYRRRRAR